MKIGIMKRTGAATTWAGLVEIDIPEEHLRGTFRARTRVARRIADALINERNLVVESIDPVHDMPPGLPACAWIATVVDADVLAAERKKGIAGRSPGKAVTRAGKPIAGHQVGVATRRHDG